MTYAEARAVATLDLGYRPFKYAEQGHVPSPDWESVKRLLRAWIHVVYQSPWRVEQVAYSQMEKVITNLCANPANLPLALRWLTIMDMLQAKAQNNAGNPYTLTRPLDKALLEAAWEIARAKFPWLSSRHFLLYADSTSPLTPSVEALLTTYWQQHAHPEGVVT
jgi:hypothetical protein